MNTREKALAMKELAKVLEKKSHEAAGGGFWEVLRGKTVIGVEWARSESELLAFLNDFQSRNRKFQGRDSYRPDAKRKPFPGNLQFTSVRKLS